MHRRLMCFTTLIVMTLLAWAPVQQPATDPLPSWNDGDSKKSVLDFVARVTKEGMPDFVPVAERIAVFDNDGTLWCEQPLYFQFIFANDRVKAMAPQHPEWANTEPFKFVLENDMEGLAKSGAKGLMEIMGATHAGMTTDEFAVIVKDWLATAKHPRFKRPFTDLVYQPMLEVLAYLRANGFQTYIVSGGGVDFMRVFAEHAYGIPPEQVIGSSGKMKFELLDAATGPALLKLPEVNSIDDKDGKPVNIELHIGRRPVMCFGNSDGDLQMLQWTTIPRGSDDHSARFGLIVHHTDAVREYAYDRQSHIGKLDKALDEAAQRGWTVASMKTDWKRIFPWESATSPAQSNAAPAGARDNANDKSGGMIWIAGGEFLMGTNAANARNTEKPAHLVRVNGFWIDATEITNAQFAKFVEATNYKTIAERPVDWNELKKQVPPGTRKPADEMLLPGALVFTPPDHPVNINDAGGWWTWTTGADWRHPEGPGSSIEGLENHPVVMVAFDDAVAYAKWAGKRLPSEAEWEFAARGGLPQKRFTWGDEEVADAQPRCNIWQGEFPWKNLKADGFERTSPVKSYPPNGYGLYDMGGNVWEWCSDQFRADEYARMLAAANGDLLINPTGPTDSWDPNDPVTTNTKHAIRGGSFLCHKSYCESYRPSARRGETPDTGMSHLGFRCVKSEKPTGDN